MKFNRVFLIILDGLGVGALPDADKFGDEGSATLQHILDLQPLQLPSLVSLGLGNIVRHPQLPAVENPEAFWGKMAEKSPAKDTTSGHWELMGVVRERAPQTFPCGFPEELIRELSARTGFGFIGNKPASGTEIIRELGPEHLSTGSLILYTSADSVLQIASHKDVLSLNELYRVCEIARQVCTGDWEVDRIIARPFVGSAKDGFVRTKERRDWSISPPFNYLDLLYGKQVNVILIGKLEDVFGRRGYTRSYHTGSNSATMQALETALRETFSGFIFANLIDFDSLYGHRNDPTGYGRALEEFDRWLSEILPKLDDRDLLIITSDHGNDPTSPSTDHSREYVPLLVFSPLAQELVEDKGLGTRESFADVGATVISNFGIPPSLRGDSFLESIETLLKNAKP